MSMPLPTDRPVPSETGNQQDLTANELDDLIWDIAVGRPTRVVLDTARRRATAAAVREQINGFGPIRHVVGLPEEA